MAKKILLETNIKRDNQKYLYCCGSTKDGRVVVLQVDKSQRSQSKKKD